MEAEVFRSLSTLGGTRFAVDSHNGIQSNPTTPQTANVARHPYRGAMTATIRGAATEPRLKPTLFSAVPSASS